MDQVTWLRWVVILLVLISSHHFLFYFEKFSCFFRSCNNLERFRAWLKSKFGSSSGFWNVLGFQIGVEKEAADFKLLRHQRPKHQVAQKSSGPFFRPKPTFVQLVLKVVPSFLPLGLKRRKFTLFLVTRRYTLLHLSRRFWLDESDHTFVFKIALFENLSRKNLSWSKILKMQLSFVLTQKFFDSSWLVLN